MAINLLGILTVVVLARLLDPESFGLVAFAMVFIAFCQIFVDQGLADAIVQKESIDGPQLDTAFWICLAIGLTLTVTTVFLAPWIAKGLDQPALTTVVQLLTSHFVIAGLAAVPNAILRRAHDFKGLAFIDFWSTLVASAVAVILAFLGWGVFALVAQSLLKGLGNMIGQFSRAKWRPRARADSASAIPILRFGVNITGIRILSFVNRRYDDFLVGVVLGTVALGYYTIAYRVLLALTSLIAGTGQKVAFPFMSRAQAKSVYFESRFYEITQWSMIIALPIFLSLAFLAEDVILGVFGTQWVQSAVLLSILSFHGLIVSATFVNGTAMLARGRPDYKLKLMIIGSAFNVVAFTVAVNLGLVALCITYAFKAYLFLPLELVYVRKIMALDLRKYLRPLRKPVLAGMIMSGGIVVLKDSEVWPSSPLVTLALLGSTAFIVFSVILLLLDRDVRRAALAAVGRVED